MKKLFGFILLAVLFISVLNLTLTKKDSLNNITIATLDALAQNESGNSEGYTPPGGYLPNTSCWISVSSGGGGNLTHVTFCATCAPELARSWSNESKCNPKND